jgi:hypothetical protein
MDDLIYFGFFGNFVYLNIVFLLSTYDDVKDPFLEAWIKFTDSKESISGHDSH